MAITGIDRPTMMHDFAITKTHAVIMDLPMLFKTRNLMTDDMPFVFDKVSLVTYCMCASACVCTVTFATPSEQTLTHVALHVVKSQTRPSMIGVLPLGTKDDSRIQWITLPKSVWC